MKLKVIISLSFITLVTIACSKGSTSATTAATTYYISNGLCYNNSNVQVDYSNCGTSTYYVSNGYCYNSSGTQVDSSNCSTTSSSASYYLGGNGYCYNSSTNVQVAYSYCTGTTGVTCSGLYLYVDYYGQTWKVTCDGVANTGNCSGYDLYKMDTGVYTQCI
jgi:hypothetical protein